MTDAGSVHVPSPVVGRHVVAIARTELRRIAEPLRRTAIMGAIALSALYALGGEELGALVLSALGISVWMYGPLELFRDRVKGDLLFLSALPVPAATVAAGKFAGAAVPSLTSAVLFAVAGALVGPDAGSSLHPLQAGLGIFFGTSLVAATTAFVTCALMVRIPMQVLASGIMPLAGLVAVIGLLWLIDTLVPDPWAAIEWLLSQSWLPPAATLVSLSLATLVSWFAFRLTAAGIRDYRPEPDAISW